ncbi:MAG: Asp-tRNA(Asn)/Glu-tRNA(Gln) amidotransferase subunit GatC [Pseudomonadota bacterium]
MSLSSAEVTRIAQLARLHLQPEEVTGLQHDLSDMLDLVGQMQAVDTQGVQPMAHPLAMTQRLRQDQVTEQNQRAAYQAVAPQVDDGLYLVPRVVE